MERKIPRPVGKGMERFPVQKRKGGVAPVWLPLKRRRERRYIEGRGTSIKVQHMERQTEKVGLTANLRGKKRDLTKIRWSHASRKEKDVRSKWENAVGCVEDMRKTTSEQRERINAHKSILPYIRRGSVQIRQGTGKGTRKSQ